MHFTWLVSTQYRILLMVGWLPMPWWKWSRTEDKERGFRRSRTCVCVCV